MKNLVIMLKTKCKICGNGEVPIAIILEVCRDCIIRRWDKAKGFVDKAHRVSREEFDLPRKEDLSGADDSSQIVICHQCVNNCKIPEGKKGFCGIKKNRDGKFYQIAGTKKIGFVDYYYDPLPTNCVASWACAEKDTGDYRKKRFALHSTSSRGNNLAVFYQTCTFDCLFCQNWHFRECLQSPRKLSASELASAVDTRTRCVCYFGGDPASQFTHSLATSLEIMKAANNKVRICWETNGSANPRMMQKAAEISLATGGTIKFDLKAFTPEIHYALTGCSNTQTLENFRLLSERMRDKRDSSVPNCSESSLLCTATLLVPGYITVDEVRKIAKFIAQCNPNIPYSLLAFYPHYLFPDLPTTSTEHAYKAEEICKEEGLKNVHIGNIHLLSKNEYHY